MRRGLVDEVFVTEDAAERFGELLVGAPIQLVTERGAKALSDTVTPVGLVAVCRMPEASLADVLARRDWWPSQWTPPIPGTPAR